MVLIQRVVPPVAQLAPLKVPEGYPRDDILELSAQRTMVGLLHQMVEISDAATDMFTRVMEEANRAFSKLSELGGRVSKLHESLPEVEEYLRSTELDSMCQNPRTDFRVTMTQDAQLFLPETKPRCLAAQYESALPPPNLGVVDEYMENGEHALNKYTNPQFFLESWIKEMERQREEAKKARAERKKRRAPRAAGNGALERRQVKTVRKKRFDPLTGELIIDDDGSAPAAPPTTPSPSAAPATPQQSLSFEAIRAAAGGGLKPVTQQIAVKKVDARSELMNSIMGGTKLRAVGDRPVGNAAAAAAFKKPVDNSVAAILSRRIAIQESDDEDEEDDEDAWSD
eukprot:m51a1_g12283 hypothetical protein (341) ;mRNA; r:246495-249719